MNAKFTEENSIEDYKKRNDYSHLPLIIKLVIIVFLLLVFIPTLGFLYLVKTPLLWSILSTIFALIFYFPQLIKKRKIEDILSFFGIEYEIKNNKLQINKCLNTTLEYCEKFATISALITFSIVSSVSGFNYYSIPIGILISVVLSFATGIMYFHYLFKFSFYLLYTVDAEEKYEISILEKYFLFYFIPYEFYKKFIHLNVFLKLILLMLIFILILCSMLFLGLEFVPKKQLFCHTNELKTVLKIIGSNICN